MANRPTATTTTPDRARLEAFLAARPPQSIVALSDRLLIATVDRSRTEGVALAREALPHVVKAANSAEAAQHLTTFAVLLACINELLGDSDDTAKLRFSLAVITRAVDVNALDEPFRSTAHYWLARAYLRRPFVDPGDDSVPTQPHLRYYMQSHRLLFAAGYGKVTVDEHAPGLPEALTPDDDNDGDATALALLCAACVQPRPNTSVLLARLAKLQVKGGDFRTTNEDPVARHHAACVAALALSLLGAPSISVG